LAGVETLAEQWLRADRVLIASSAAFDFPATTLPPNVRYVGPAFWEAPSEAGADLPGEDGLPVVLASPSTTYQAAERYLRTLVLALGRLAVRGLVTTGPGYDLARLAPLPPSVTVHHYLPHSAALARASAVVTHAGHGTVLKALAHGVPMVCVP